MSLILICGIFLMLLISKAVVDAAFSQADNCKIFCEGPLLDAVQRAHLFDDSKYFVDMPLLYDPDTTMAAFERLPNKSDVDALRHFVDEYFIEPGTELKQCHQPDWVPEPASFDKIKDPVYRQFAIDIHRKWRTLCRRMNDDVKKNPNRYSLIHVPHPFVAPGGRFREFYYWDTYWIVKGLISSQMYNSTKLMILNLAEMVKRFGFIPNGGRIYYLHRTQPPLFSACVYEYFKATNDLTFVNAMLPLMEKERQYWDRERRVDYKTEDGETFQLYQYRVSASGPRPESYKEDIDTASHVNTNQGKKQVWSDIAAAAESGWDFSSRWFTRDESSPFRNSLRGIRTSKVIPVDLNAFVCWNDALMSEMYEAVGNYSQAQQYRSQHHSMRYAMKRAFWNEELGSWFDLDMDTNAHRLDYYVSNPTPLFTGCFDNDRRSTTHKRVLSYLKESGASNFAGGLPTSLIDSGEQWDSPNGWAPTNHMVIEGFRNSNDPLMQEAGFRLANKWIQTNYFVYVRSGGKMFEKYNVEMEKSRAGGGGEYEVQEGFGWTNGVVLDLLLQYGDRLRAPPVPPIIFDKQPILPEY